MSELVSQWVLILSSCREKKNRSTTRQGVVLGGGGVGAGDALGAGAGVGGRLPSGDEAAADVDGVAADEGAVVDGGAAAKWDALDDGATSTANCLGKFRSGYTTPGLAAEQLLPR